MGYTTVYEYIASNYTPEQIAIAYLESVESVNVGTDGGTCKFIVDDVNAKLTDGTIESIGHTRVYFRTIWTTLASILADRSARSILNLCE